MTDPIASLCLHPFSRPANSAPNSPKAAAFPILTRHGSGCNPAPNLQRPGPFLGGSCGRPQGLGSVYPGPKAREEKEAECSRWVPCKNAPHGRSAVGRRGGCERGCSHPGLKLVSGALSCKPRCAWENTSPAAWRQVSGHLESGWSRVQFSEGHRQRSSPLGMG
ncbi:hypothetical protein VTI74DRAFT_8999 [Chaetomium olivicolor]